MLAGKSSATLADRFVSLFPSTGFPSALAPMQDVTGLPFMGLISGYGPPDLFLLNILEFIPMPV